MDNAAAASTNKKRSFMTTIRSMFHLPSSVKSKIVVAANVTFFSLRWVMNAAWIATTLAILVIAPLSRCIEYERAVRRIDRKNAGRAGPGQTAPNNSNIANALPQGL
ncbi:hypothetical protein SAMD00019534_000390 [Acytostelium subglobosum LB1]|uniref:hypothetical protein n=1 Tax=Acytostelium subglobosum LB1 TaxID=1410327 RepID=UPI00064482B6|nr:hypothetical protein SAMD00019534_000390 [Acytostelium subglobosum LB1]GAM16864.1 hypothetical protein SAMD00019534_000390 [Acytostelium subglobosum LB1]|eukprot:XP_012758926.1 hypothetical protein SAMD00019534_000390 [Acytostelium subglobosum LB1]